MRRQYLNVLYSPTAAYKGYTEGLCGFMDNNAANDFAGPDGTVYNDAAQFAESCKISYKIFLQIVFAQAYSREAKSVERKKAREKVYTWENN